MSFITRALVAEREDMGKERVVQLFITGTLVVERDYMGKERVVIQLIQPKLLGP